MNKTTEDARELAQKLVTDPAYLASLAKRLIKGKAGPVEVTVWHYAYGKPKEIHELVGKDGGPIQLAAVKLDAYQEDELQQIRNFVARQIEAKTA